MRDIEDLLTDAPLRAPTPRLRASVEDTLARAAAEERRWFRLPVPLWACAAIAIVCAALGALTQSALAPVKPPGIVYVLPAEGEVRRLLMGEAESRRERGPEEWRVTVTVPPKAKL